MKIESLSRDQRPIGLTDYQYKMYCMLAIDLRWEIDSWAISLLLSFGTETLCEGTISGYVAKWIRETDSDHLFGLINEVIDKAQAKAKKEAEEDGIPRCPRCNSRDKKVVEIKLYGLGVPVTGCEWYCYSCTNVF